MMLYYLFIVGFIYLILLCNQVDSENESKKNSVNKKIRHKKGIVDAVKVLRLENKDFDSMDINKQDYLIKKKLKKMNYIGLKTE